MTIRELKRLIKKLPDDMEVLMTVGEDNIVTVCKENSEVVQITDQYETIDLLLLVPCSCSAELEADIDEAQLN